MSSFTCRPCLDAAVARNLADANAHANSVLRERQRIPVPSDLPSNPAVRALVEQAPECMRAGIYTRLASIDHQKLHDNRLADVAMIARCDANRVDHVDHVGLVIGTMIEGFVVETFSAVVPVSDDAADDLCVWFNMLWQRRRTTLQYRFTDYERERWLCQLITACAQALIDHHRAPVPA